MTLAEYVDTVGDAYAGVGRPPLEGRLAALLLAHEYPLSLTDAARLLGVSKVGLLKVATRMLERGDIQRSEDRHKRRHLYSLTDHIYFQDLRVQLQTSHKVAEAILAYLAGADGISPEVRKRMESQARTVEQAAELVEQVVRYHPQPQWDALPPRKGRSRSAKRSEH